MKASIQPLVRGPALILIDPMKVPIDCGRACLRPQSALPEISHLHSTYKRTLCPRDHSSVASLGAQAAWIHGCAVFRDAEGVVLTNRMEEKPEMHATRDGYDLP